MNEIRNITASRPPAEPAVAAPAEKAVAAPAKRTVDGFERRHPSELVAIGALGGMTVGTLVSMSLVFGAAASATPVETWALTKASLLVFGATTGSGAVLGGAAAALNALAEALVTRVRGMVR